MAVDRVDWWRWFLRERAAAPMVGVAFAFTVLVAMWLQRSVGVTNLLLGRSAQPGEMLAFQLLVSALWPVFFLEFLGYYLTRDRAQPFWRTHWPGLAACVVPPLRMGALPHVRGGDIRLPRLGWRKPTRELRRAMERFFSAPMIVIALMILPLLAIEFIYHEAVAQRLWLAVTLDVATGFIWLAFTVEFILMFSIAPSKVRYLQRHWIDAAIITLPLIAWLRAFRVLRLARLTQVTRMTRLYRLRGVAMRLLRALLLLGMVQRILHRTPDRRLARLREQIIEKQWEIAEIREDILRTMEEIRSLPRPVENPAPESAEGDGLILRDATPADAPVLAELIRELGYPAGAETVRCALETYANHDPARTIVAQRDGQVIGLVSLMPIPMFHRPHRVCRVTTMVVAEAHRGRGVGEKLLREALAAAERWRCERIEVTCAEHRTDAHAFYESLGFTVLPRRYVKVLLPHDPRP